jgi:hypothetical protein
MTLYKELVELLLPEGVLTYFEVSKLEKESNQLRIFIEERDTIPEEYSKERYRSNGFLPEKKVKDFPIRDMFVTLHIKRRRWLLIETGKKVSRDWSMVAPGTRITKGFAAFLKELSRY